MFSHIHFISTGPNFPYPYYLAIISAVKTQKFQKATLWVTKKPIPYGEHNYYNLVEHLVDVRPVHELELSALKSSTNQFYSAHLKDYLEWQILYWHGGLFLDLDTFSLADASDVLESDKEVVATPYQNPALSMAPFNNAIVIAKPKSIIIEECMDSTFDILKNQKLCADDWGITGPGIFSRTVMQHLDRVTFPPYGIWGKPWWEVEEIVSTIEAFKDDGKLTGVERILHLFASSQSLAFESLDEHYIHDSDSLVARLARQTLSKKELYPYEY